MQQTSIHSGAYGRPCLSFKKLFGQLSFSRAAPHHRKPGKVSVCWQTCLASFSFATLLAPCLQVSLHLHSIHNAVTVSVYALQSPVTSVTTLSSPSTPTTPVVEAGSTTSHNSGHGVSHSIRSLAFCAGFAICCYQNSIRDLSPGKLSLTLVDFLAEWTGGP